MPTYKISLTLIVILTLTLPLTPTPNPDPNCNLRNKICVQMCTSNVQMLKMLVCANDAHSNKWPIQGAPHFFQSRLGLALSSPQPWQKSSIDNGCMDR